MGRPAFDKIQFAPPGHGDYQPRTKKTPALIRLWPRRKDVFASGLSDCVETIAIEEVDDFEAESELAAMAGEVAHRWNAHDRLVAAVQNIQAQRDALLATVEALYTRLADFRAVEWPSRFSADGQALLCSLRDSIVKATSRDERDVQDDYGTRLARAEAAKKPEGGV